MRNRPVPVRAVPATVGRPANVPLAILSLATSAVTIAALAIPTLAAARSAEPAGEPAAAPGAKPAGETEPAAAPTGGLLAGVARVDITPEYPVRLNGFGFRREESEGVNQRIWAKALALRSGSAPPVVLLAVDNTGLRESMLDEVASRLESRAGIPRERIVLTFTHSHTTPKVNGSADTIFGTPIPAAHQERIDRYTRELTDSLERAALSAAADLRPATLEWGVGEVKFAANRRTRGGPVDHDLPTLLVRGPDGAVRCVWTTYACHCVTLSHNRIGGDWAGYAQARLEASFPGATAMVSIGCGSDADPDSGVVGDRVEVAEAQGSSVADEVARLVKAGLRPISGEPSTRLVHVDLPLRDPPSAAELEHLAAQPTPAGYNAAFQLARLKRGESLETTIRYPIQTVTFGDSLLVVFLAGEVCVDYAIRLRKELRSDRLWLHAYSNDFPAYIPSERLLREGGYGGGSEIVYFALPARFREGLEDTIAEAVRRLTPAAFRRE